MMMIRRVALFLATNLAVLVLLGIVMSVLEKVFGIQLGNNGSLLVFAAVFGFGGSMVSLLLSKTLAKRSTGAQVISQPRNEVERWLFQTVERQAREAGIVACSAMKWRRCSRTKSATLPTATWSRWP